MNSKQLRFYGAMSACPRNPKRGLGDVEGSLGIPGRSVSPRRAPVDEVRYGRWNLLRPFESAFEQWDGGLEFTVERMSVS